LKHELDVYTRRGGHTPAKGNEVEPNEVKPLQVRRTVRRERAGRGQCRSKKKKGKIPNLLFKKKTKLSPEQKKKKAAMTRLPRHAQSDMGDRVSPKNLKKGVGGGRGNMLKESPPQKPKPRRKFPKKPKK